jgi:diaminopimelate epimerase
LKIVKDPKNVKFIAVDGLHEAEIIEDDVVKLKMQDVDTIAERNGHPFLCSGTTAHNVVFVEDLTNFPVAIEGQKLQKVETDPKGVNVNFVVLNDGVLNVRTYERGVWDETMACGTGATSVAIAVHNLGMITENVVQIKMPGGDLEVTFERMPDGIYQNIWLTGEARCVFKGEIK